MHFSSKTYGHDVGLSCCFRQWRVESHCNLLHGYALKVHLEFEARTLDGNGWVVDFGGLKPFKEWLVSKFDHTLLVANDDPELPVFNNLQHLGLAKVVEMQRVGCEAFAMEIYGACHLWLQQNGYTPRVTLAKVTVSEHGANSAAYSEG